MHIVMVLLMFSIGRAQLWPSHFDDNGLGIFAADSYIYENEIMYLARLLKTEGFLAWAIAPSQLHLRLYSLFYAPFSSWTRFNILTVEPLNLFYYLASLVLVFKVGREIYDRRAGLLAATIVALWPSLLLHTTQLLRDPLLDVVMLALLLIMTRALTSKYSWQAGLLSGACACLTLILLYIVRAAMWDVVRIMAGLGFVLLLIRMWRERRLLAGSLIVSLALLCSALMIPKSGGFFKSQQMSPSERGTTFMEKMQAAPFWQRVAERREKFIKESRRAEGQSNLDDDVSLRSLGDIVLYLPRAAIIGFFAPFPNMWMSGRLNIGLLGSLLAGLETLLMYLNCFFIIVALREKYHNLALWLVLLTAAAGMLGLGLIVVNVGSLYRLRYIYWILLVILGAGGFVRLWSRTKFLEELF